jgi:hypothetical protein
MTERFGEPKLATLDHRHFGTMRPRQREWKSGTLTPAPVAETKTRN